MPSCSMATFAKLCTFKSNCFTFTFLALQLLQWSTFMHPPPGWLLNIRILRNLVNSRNSITDRCNILTFSFPFLSSLSVKLTLKTNKGLDMLFERNFFDYVSVSFFQPSIIRKRNMTARPSKVTCIPQRAASKQLKYFCKLLFDLKTMPFKLFSVLSQIW